MSENWQARASAAPCGAGRFPAERRVPSTLRPFSWRAPAGRGPVEHGLRESFRMKSSTLADAAPNMADYFCPHKAEAERGRGGRALYGSHSASNGGAGGLPDPVLCGPARTARPTRASAVPTSPERFRGGRLGAQLATESARQDLAILTTSLTFARLTPEAPSRPRHPARLGPPAGGELGVFQPSVELMPVAQFPLRAQLGL